MSTTHPSGAQTAPDETNAGPAASGPAVRPRLARAVALLPAVYFAGVTMLFAWPVLLGRSTSAVPGFQAQIWPWRGVVDTSAPAALQADGGASSHPWSVTYHLAMRKLELPFWDWHSFSGGYDLGSDGVAGVMYPVHWMLWWAFEPATAHDLYVILHLWVGGLLMYVLLRHWHVRPGAALVGGTAWMLAPFNVGWLQAEMITPVLVIVPLSFWTVSAALTKGSWARIFGASAALALALVAGNIVVFMVVVWVVALYAGALWLIALAVRRPARELRRTALTLLGIAVGTLALSAYSLVPTLLNLLSLSRRPMRLDQALLQQQQQSAAGVIDSLWNAPAIDSQIALFALNWCGRIVLVLAVVGLLHRGGRRVLGLSLVVVFTLLSVSPWVVHVCWYLIPPLRAVSGFGRLTFLASFGIALLAALGANVLIALLSRIQRRAPRLPGSRLLPVVAGPLLAAVVVWELLPFARAINPPWTDPDDHPFMPVTEAHESLRRADSAWPGLVIPLASSTGPTGESHNSLWGATAHIGGVDSVGGYDSALPRRATALTRVIQGTPAVAALEPIGGAYLPSFGIEWTRLDLAERLGVTHVYAPPGVSLTDSVYAASLPELRRVHRGPDGQVWELEKPMRGPRLVDHAVFVGSPAEALERFTAPDHQARTAVVLEQGPRSSGLSAAAEESGGPPGEVMHAERGYDEVQVTVRAGRGAWLVLPIGYAPGWRAEMDGTPVAVRPADFAMSAVRVPSGTHTITFSYRPVGLRLGMSMTLVALAAGLILFLRSLIRGRAVLATRTTSTGAIT